ncbi:MAG: RNA-binding protein [Salinivirgaceae bacterium]|nr:RNA-binding protein [Salinivirgaceae bacterium]
MKLFIGNLDDKIQSSHLREAFQEFGKVNSAKVIKDKSTGKSKGFGFIDMPNKEEAVKVIEDVNGGKWEGKVITIREAY